MRYIFLLSIFISCAHQHVKLQTEIRNNYLKGEFRQSIEVLDKSDYKKNDSNKLLYLMEKGRLQLMSQEYLKAFETFTSAIELKDKLYTKSVSNEIKVATQSESKGIYYGTIVEKNYLYFASIISLYHLSLKDNSYKSKIRNILISWDSYLQTIKKENDEVESLIQWCRFNAAIMHEYLNTRRDSETALILYKNIKISADKNKVVNHYVDYKVQELSKRLKRPVSKKIKFSKESKNILAQMSEKKITFLLEKGLVSEYGTKEYSLNLGSQIDEIDSPALKETINQIGVPVLAYFMLGPLGLGTTTYVENNIAVTTRHNLGEKLIKEVGLEYEIPYTSYEDKNYDYYLVLKNGKKQILKKKLFVLSDLSSLALSARKIREQSIATKRKSRIALKYLTAAVASYSTFKSISNNDPNNLLARSAAYAQFLLAQKTILETEKPDTRYWSTMPAKQLICDVSVPEGQYQVFMKIFDQNSSLVDEVYISKIEINSSTETFFSYALNTL